MKKTREIKLNLDKQTISKLGQKAIKGGQHYTCTPTCTQTALHSQCGNLQCY
ncbi:hypothetical protein U6A24_08200 [Aquimarina gracilis]|uniref:Natural product n=1 Tax=Aquimarina gracilis TaxID=874422 RepID=A0ABU5ZTQ0_9FLAO|nr:hypothetical protein [Aquimarina gracilis]MEB3345435.1 hypothetical protein [Aquimarina gracilis]